jgi:pimeloyl-ACP methyl ester carboxylesterase
MTGINGPAPLQDPSQAEYYLARMEAKPLQARVVEVDGTRLHYLVGGEGPPLVLVHGLGGSASNWVELAPLLAQRFRLVVPDLAGHGRSAPARPPVMLDTFAEHLHALMLWEGMPSAAVVGHSFGGTVALQLAARRPAAVRAIVLAAPAGITSSTARFANLIAALVIARPGRLAAPFRRPVGAFTPLRYAAFWWWQVSDPAALSARAVEGFLEGPGLHQDVASAGRALIGHDPRHALDRVHSPALVLWGARDRLVPLADGFEYARRLRAPLRVIADCAHLLIGERPDACAAAIEEFLELHGVLGLDELPHEAEALG